MSRLADFKAGPLGAAKAWVKFQTDATVDASYNITSVVRNALGDFTITFDEDFASADYVALVSLDSSAGLRTALFDTQAAGTIDVRTVNTSSGALVESSINSVFCVFFGQ